MAATSIAPVVSPLPMPEPAPVAHIAAVVKLSMRGETHRFTIPIEELSWEAINGNVHDCYEDASRPKLWTLIYRDNEDDLVTISNAQEFHEACRVFAELKEQPSSSCATRKLHLHFHVVARVTLKDQLAPVMNAVGEISEKMARIAAETRESLRRSTVVERGRESLYLSAVQTRNTLTSAGRGISRRVRRATTAVAGEISEIRRRTRSRMSSYDMDDVNSPEALMASSIDRDMADPARELDVMDLLAQARAEEEAAERRALEAAAANVAARATDRESLAHPSTTATSVDSNGQSEEADGNAHASDAETASTASEDVEWDFVRSSSAADAVPLSPYFEEDDEMEVAFSAWEVQVWAIRDIMPQIPIQRCIDVLDKHNGDLEAALLELTEA